MTTNQARARGPLWVKCTRDELQTHAYSHAVLRFAGKIPTRMGATEALVALQRGVAALVRGLPDSDSVSVLNPYVSSGKGTQPYAVVVSLVVPIEVRETLLGRRSDAGWLDLPAPWGGQVALSPIGGGDLQEVHLRRLPLGFDLSLLQEKLKQKGVNATNLTHLIDPTTGFPRADAASALVPNGTQFPGGIFILQKPDGSVLASVQVSSASRLPPAPGEEAAGPAAGGSYAAAAAAGAGIIRPRPASRPGDGAAGSAAAATGQTAAEGAAATASTGTDPGPQRQQRQQLRGRSPPHRAAAGGGIGAADQRARSQPAARPRPAVDSERADEQGSEAKRQCTEQPQPAGRSHSPAGSPGGGTTAGGTTAGGGGGVTTTNPFAQLSHSDDMDADAADLLAADAIVTNATT